MALLDQMRKVKSKRGLFETSLEETQDLAKKRGLKAPPITALGVSGIGGTPDQAKMAGTKAQKQKAFDLGTGETLQRAKDIRQPQAEPDAKDPKQEFLTQTLGDVGARVDQYVQSALTKDYGQAKLRGTGVAEVDTVVREINESLSADPSGLDIQDKTWSSLYSHLGGDLTNSADIKEKIKEVLPASTPDQVELIGSHLTQSILGEDGFSLSDLGEEEYIEQIATALGESVEDVSKMTLPQLEDKVSEIQAEEFSQGQNLKNVVDNPNVSEADRALARQQLSDLGVVGTLTTEAELDDLLSEVEQAQTIKIGDTQMDVEELLSDEGLTMAVDQILRGGPYASAFMKDPDYKEFVEFVNRNKSALSAVSTITQTEAGAFEDLQRQNRAQYEAVADLEPEDLAELGISFNQIAVTNKDIDQKAAFVEGLKKNPKWKAQLNDITKSKTADDMLRAAYGLSVGDIVRQLEIAKQNEIAGQGDAEAIARLTNLVNLSNDPGKLRGFLKQELLESGKANTFALKRQHPPVESILTEEQANIQTNPRISSAIADGSLTPAELNSLSDEEQRMLASAYPHLFDKQLANIVSHSSARLVKKLAKELTYPEWADKMEQLGIPPSDPTYKDMMNTVFEPHSPQGIERSRAARYAHDKRLFGAGLDIKGVDREGMHNLLAHLLKNWPDYQGKWVRGKRNTIDEGKWERDIEPVIKSKLAAAEIPMPIGLILSNIKEQVRSTIRKGREKEEVEQGFVEPLEDQGN